MIRQMPALMYDQGCSINIARGRLEGQQGRMEASISQQIVHQMRLELEQLLQILREPLR
jgi:hypothetical protein